MHIKSNTRHPYACVLLDFNKNKIVDVLQSRKKYYLKRYFERISIKELDSVKYVVMDLWSPYRDIVRKYMPKAKIVADAFHVIVNINRILDEKRRQVMNKYRKEHKNKYNNTLEIPYKEDFGYLLKKYSWMIRMNPKNIKGKFYYIHKHKFSKYSLDILNHLLSSDDELREIYNLRNMYQSFNDNNDIKTVEENLEDLIHLFINHEIYEIRRYGKTLELWLIHFYQSFFYHR